MTFIKPAKSMGWAVIGIPEGDDGTNVTAQQPFILRDNIIGEMVKDTVHPQESYIEVVKEQPIHSDEFEQNDDENSDKESEE